MAKRKKKSHARAPGKTSITFSCSEELRDQIDEVCQGDKRTRANWIVVQLSKIVASKLAALKLGESDPKYSAASIKSARTADAPRTSRIKQIHGVNE